MGNVLSEIRYAVRVLVKHPGFAIATILIVGLGVGANTAIFSALDQVSMRTLPVRKAHELVSVQYSYLDGGGSGTDGSYSYPVYEAFRDQTGAFSDLIGFSSDEMHVRIGNRLTEARGLGVTGNYFTTLGVRPALGRLFDAAQEPDPAPHPVAVIGHRFWQRQFDSRRDVIGRQIMINGRFLTIVGVTPPEFHGTVVGWAADVYVPGGTQAAMSDMDVHKTTYVWLYLLGRLKDGVGRDQARASLRAVSERLDEAGYANIHTNVLVADGRRGWISWESQQFRRPLVLFLIVAALVLIIASANIAGMQLSRAAGRRKEIAIRQALGARRRHIIRQLLIESLLLALVGGACGVVLAVWLDRIVCVLLSRIGSTSMIAGLDLRVLLFALGLSLLTGLLFGLFPALQTTRRNVTPMLKDSGGATLPGHRWNPHSLLAVFQVTVAVVVLVCTGLFVRSVLLLNRLNPGYDTRRLLTASLKWDWRIYGQDETRQFFEHLHARVRNLPGVETTCLASGAPFDRISMRTVTHVDGVEIPEKKRSSWSYHIVGPEYFKMVNMPLLAGRVFSDRDSLQAPRVMVVNDIMARKRWPNQDPVGHTVTFRGGRNQPMTVTVIGVVKASKTHSLIDEERPCAYWPIAQDTRTTPALLVRTTGDPQSLIPVIRKEAAALGLNRVCQVSTVADRIAGRLFPQRAVTMVLNVFALAGVVLCITGLYSVISYAAKQRTREIGIRMALGAEARHVFLSVLGKGTWLAGIGLALGLAGSLAAIGMLQIKLADLQRWDRFVLHGVNLWDPVTLVVAPLLVFAVALLACFFPARRAAGIDPMAALRYE